MMCQVLPLTEDRVGRNGKDNHATRGYSFSTFRRPFSDNVISLTHRSLITGTDIINKPGVIRCGSVFMGIAHFVKSRKVHRDF